jgi:hypothetical protein
MHDTANSIHFYHLVQIQKILQDFLKKRRAKMSLTKMKEEKLGTSGSFLDDAQYNIFQYLIWNIIIKSWLLSRILKAETNSVHSEEIIKKFEKSLQVFIKTSEIHLPIAEVARIQIHALMNKAPPKIESKNFGKLTNFLSFFRNYATKEIALINAEPKWGNHRVCKELFSSCFYLGMKIHEMIDPNFPPNEK